MANLVRRQERDNEQSTAAKTFHPQHNGKYQILEGRSGGKWDLNIEPAMSILKGAATRQDVAGIRLMLVRLHPAFLAS